MNEQTWKYVKEQLIDDFHKLNWNLFTEGFTLKVSQGELFLFDTKKVVAVAKIELPKVGNELIEIEDFGKITFDKG